MMTVLLTVFLSWMRRWGPLGWRWRRWRRPRWRRWQFTTCAKQCPRTL
jgi:hypothetical protein